MVGVVGILRDFGERLGTFRFDHGNLLSSNHFTDRCESSVVAYYWFPSGY